MKLRINTQEEAYEIINNLCDDNNYLRMKNFKEFTDYIFAHSDITNIDNVYKDIMNNYLTVTMDDVFSNKYRNKIVASTLIDKFGWLMLVYIGGDTKQGGEYTFPLEVEVSADILCKCFNPYDILTAQVLFKEGFTDAFDGVVDYCYIKNLIKEKYVICNNKEYVVKKLFKNFDILATQGGMALLSKKI